MTILYDEKASLTQTLNRVEDLRWAQLTHTSALVCVGPGPFNLGRMVFNRVSDLPKQIAETTVKISENGRDVHPHASRIILSPGIASFNFSSGSEFLTLMSGIKDEPMVCGTEGANLSAQLRGLNPWQSELYAKHVKIANEQHTNDNKPLIKIVDSENGPNYIFPSIAAMKDFCAFVESQSAGGPVKGQERHMSLGVK